MATLQRKIEAHFFEKKVSPGRVVDKFIIELDTILQDLHNVPFKNNLHHQKNHQKNNQNNKYNDQKEKRIIPYENVLKTIELNQHQFIISSTGVMKHIDKNIRQNNYNRLVKRLKYKFRSANVILQKTDKAKVFHIGTIEDYKKKSNDYMKKTQAYKYLKSNDPLTDLIERTNKYLLNLRFKKMY